MGSGQLTYDKHILRKEFNYYSCSELRPWSNQEEGGEFTYEL